MGERPQGAEGTRGTNSGEQWGGLGTASDQRVWSGGQRGKEVPASGWTLGDSQDPQDPACRSPAQKFKFKSVPEELVQKQYLTENL